ncbi:efflux RND transporter permease subunit [Shewanella sp. NIFS-20-20]|uniref:efflux RND transporter permease subunit n=1 Tax=Shewanella sp. NIFS-20-20 TaxID=2853806 RepID=UPI001C46F401|nr:efflux RND transporter permease subunit [Shewanella sp. NIFS-20-20]MBV7316403.1 efflux RND transporter permease subunit [Shewanella sp. NIFS-20-20]
MVKSLVENGRLASLLIALLLVAGLGALSTLPRMEDPHITNRFASVITHYPGASAERVEVLVTEVIENQLRRLEEIKLVQSTSRPGISVIQLELKDSVINTDPVWSRARDLLADTSDALPAAAGHATLDDQFGYANTAILGFSWQDSTTNTDNVAILSRYGKELQHRLRLLSGTDFVSLYGAPSEEILVELNADVLNRIGLTSGHVAAILQQADPKVAAGEINNNYFRALIEVSGELDSVTRIQQVPLKTTDTGQVVRLADVAKVSRTVKTPLDNLALLDGEQGIMLGVRMLNNTRVDHWLSSVRSTVSEYEQQLPSNIKIDWLFEQESYTTVRLGDLVVNLIQGFVLILLVLLLTLGIRNALIVALALPLTALFTLLCMQIVNLPIHQMSVTGLVVALGIMVDNAIVIVDAIAQRRREGQSAIEAVRNTLSHLWVPLAGSTITTMLAFAPIVLMPGAAGEFVGGIAISVIFALLGSYLISHTLIAGLAGRFGSHGQQSHWYQRGIDLPWLSRAFRHSLNVALKRPLLAGVVIGMLPLSGFWAAGQMTEQFFPPSDRDMFHIEVYFPAHHSVAASSLDIQAIDSELRANPDILRLDWLVGGNTPSFYYNLTQRQNGAANYAQAMVKVADYQQANRLIPLLQQQLDQHYPNAMILVRKLEQGPPFNAPIEMRIFGPNLDTLTAIGDDVRYLLAQHPNVLHSRTTLSAGAPKLWLDINEDASLLSGLDLSTIAGQIQMATTGVLGGSVLETSESLPVRVRVEQQTRTDERALMDLNLNSAQGSNIPLSALASMDIKVSRGAIPRRDGHRINTVEAYITTGTLPAKVLTDIKHELDALVLPSGYHIEIGGESAKRNEAVGNLLSSIILVITALLATLVLSFNSFRLTLIILLSAVQSAGLGLLCVYVFGYPFGFTVIVGLLGLMGLAINAAIVILAELQEIDSAQLNCDSTIVAVSSCGRHIASTTITTIGGFLPLIIAGGGFWPPFAIAIAGGTLLTTLISLIWVPVIYSLMIPQRASLQSSPA